MSQHLAERWVEKLRTVTRATAVTVCEPPTMPRDLATGVDAFLEAARLHVEQRLGRIILFGNGGSLAIAAHMATDFSLAGWPSLALTDAVALTSHTNDYGQTENFSKQIELMKPSWDDIIVAMSCSGNSMNVTEPARRLKNQGHFVVTLTGFASDNQLRRVGSLNFWVPSHVYGLVQLAHESILHSICDIKNGWGK